MGSSSNRPTRWSAANLLAWRTSSPRSRRTLADSQVCRRPSTVPSRVPARTTEATRSSTGFTTGVDAGQSGHHDRTDYGRRGRQGHRNRRRRDPPRGVLARPIPRVRAMTAARCASGVDLDAVRDHFTSARTVIPLSMVHTSSSCFAPASRCAGSQQMVRTVDAEQPSSTPISSADRSRSSAAHRRPLLREEGTQCGCEVQVALRWQRARRLPRVSARRDSLPASCSRPPSGSRCVMWPVGCRRR